MVASLRTLPPMDWETFVAGAQAVGWVTYVGTSDGDGSPHVAVVAPGFTEGTIWFATRYVVKQVSESDGKPEHRFSLASWWRLWPG